MEEVPECFIKPYFDGKDLEGLKKAITPNWNDNTLNMHLELINCPEDATKIVEFGCGIGRFPSARLPARRVHRSAATL